MAGGSTMVSSSPASQHQDHRSGEDLAFPAIEMCAASSSVQSSEKRDPGLPVMTPDTLRDCCKQNNGFEAPDLNDVLILHYKGFRKIESLESYTNVKSMFLECNGIRRIENLEVLQGMVSLYLQQNCIQRIENVDALKNLQYLNLAHNSISIVENLAPLHSLETLNLSANKFVDVEALRGLAERPTLQSVDVSYNYFEDGDALVEFWPHVLPDVTCLYLHHNPCSRGMKDYRRRVISSLKRLRWLDERPVQKMERVGCEAWADGGKDAEMQAKKDFWWSEKHAKEKSFQAFRKMQHAAAERAKAQKAMQETSVESPAPAMRAAVSTGSCMEDADPDVSALPSEDRGAAVRAKVQAFLAKQRPPPDASNDLASSASACDTDVAGAASSPVEEVCDGEVDSKALTQLDTAPEPGEAAELVPFEWNAFRDRRLGRLAAEMRLKYDRIAAALSDEFGCTVDAEDCRRRYRELVRPSNVEAGAGHDRSSMARKRMQADAGKAKDAPPPDAAVVRDFSQWWVKKMTVGDKATVPSVGGAERELVAVGGADEAACRQEQAAEALGLGSLDDAISAVASGVRNLRDNDRITASPVGTSSALQASTFAPPPRQSAPATRQSASGSPMGVADGFVETSCVVPAKPRSEPVAVPKVPTAELFQLD